jgi:hypothetical protein
MTRILDTVLLLALPASGKSEVRKYLAALPAEACRDDFHMGPTVQLDDYPYVEFMRKVDELLDQALGQPNLFFQAHDRPFQDPWDWGTLIHLLNEDYEDLVMKKPVNPSCAALHLFGRFDEAARKAGARPKFGGLADGVRAKLANLLEQDARKLITDKVANYTDTLDGKTLVIEFARGGADGSAMPLQAPFGYGYSVGQLSPQILSRASILYVWVTPEESRRKNHERSVPPPGVKDTILFHGVPIAVMMEDYGCDDLEWLLSSSDRPDTAHVATHDHTWHLPTARFDNRNDLTSFIRKQGKPENWNAADKAALHAGLKAALDVLAGVPRE